MSSDKLKLAPPPICRFPELGINAFAVMIVCAVPFMNIPTFPVALDKQVKTLFQKSLLDCLYKQH
jgi:hypothetical protein